MVVQAVRDGMTQTAAAKTYGVSLRAVSKWMKLALDGGLRALRPGKRGRLPGSGRLNGIVNLSAVARTTAKSQSLRRQSTDFERCR
nr:helix-turn-helix domain-containing protein [Paraburkholderia youngii]